MILSPIEPLILNKRHLIVIPSGPLTSIPFHVLLTADSGATSFSDASWLVKRHAVSVLPAVSSLRALRSHARPSTAKRPYIGFANPEFCRRPINRSTTSPRALSVFFRGRAADPEAMCKGLSPLPETAQEIQTVARALGATNPADVVIGASATEGTIKRLSQEGRLDQYRILHFATHGLVAGEIKGLAEPALALTVPDIPTETDDGLLTASEVATLKLNADLVLLSACNTAAGERPSADALSGLAKAFFYGGARALLVSHWYVDSDAAVELTTGMFSELSAKSEIGRSDALRRSMLALLAKQGASAHPAIWGPFVIVGEGLR